MDHSISVDVSFAAVWSVLIVLTVLHASIRLLKWRQGLESPEERQLEVDIKTTKVAISKLSVVSDFVQRSKLERQLVKLEKDLKTAAGARAAAVKAADIPSLLSRYAVPALYLLLAMTFWNTPVAVIPPSLIGPLSYTLAFPGWPRGTVSIVAWLTICHSTLPRLLAVVLPAPKQDTQAGGMLGKIMSMLPKS